MPRRRGRVSCGGTDRGAEPHRVHGDEPGRDGQRRRGRRRGAPAPAPGVRLVDRRRGPVAPRPADRRGAPSRPGHGLRPQQARRGVGSAHGGPVLDGAAAARGLLWMIGSVVHLTGRATVLSADKANEFLAPAWTCRADALTRDTGWRAETDLATGLKRTADWYRSTGWLS